MTSDAFAELENLLKLGPRESATNQESVAARYLQEKFQDLGYDTEIQEFTVSDLELKGLGLAVNTSQQVEVVALPMIESGLGSASGKLTRVGLAMPGDIPESGLEGQIAFAKRGVIRFQS